MATGQTATELWLLLEYTAILNNLKAMYNPPWRSSHGKPINQRLIMFIY